MKNYFNHLLLGGGVAALLGVSMTHCAPEPRLRVPALGEKITISAIAVDQVLAPSVPRTSGIKLNVMWGGRPISSSKGDPTLNFYDQNQQLLYSFKWAELETAYKDSSCTHEQVASLDGYLQGAALLCDGRLNLKGVIRIEGLDTKGEKRTATSWGVYQIDEDVTSISIGLY